MKINIIIIKSIFIISAYLINNTRILKTRYLHFVKKQYNCVNSTVDS